jgi:hypothetical protein
MWMHGVVILHQAIDEGERSDGIGDRADPDIVAFQGFDERFGHAIAFRAFDWREAWQQVESTAISVVLWAAKIEPLSESHCTACGARIVPQHCSTQ